MVSIEQWRSAIGLHSDKGQRERKTFVFYKDSPAADRWKYLCGGLFVNALMLWGVYFELCILCTLLHQPFVDTLTQAGDVEKNPGPTFEEQLSKLSDNINDNINEKFGALNCEIKKLSHEIGELKTSLNDVRSSVNKLSDDMDSLTNKVDVVEEKQLQMQLDINGHAETVASLDERMDDVESAIESQERYSRRENVILHGVPEGENEEFVNGRKKACEILNDKVRSKHWREDDFLRAHRLGGKKREDGRPRPFIIRFFQCYDKMKVLRARDIFKTSGIRVSDDLTKTQRAELQKLRDRGERGYYRGGRLIIDNHTSAPFESNPGTAPVDRRLLTAARQLPRGGNTR